MATHYEDGERLDERLLLEDGVDLIDSYDRDSSLFDLQNRISNGEYAGDGSVDVKGNPVLNRNTGNWKACPFILGTECCERLAYYGIVTNLVSYLTKKLNQGNAHAARNVTTWQGTCYLTPLIGAVIADAYWGRYWTIFAFSTIYFLGMCTLALSVTVPGFKPSDCVGSTALQLALLSMEFSTLDFI